MKKLETKEDIIEWATVIVAAKGEKFTPMSKGDLYAVANYILESAAKPEQSGSDGDSMVAEEANKGEMEVSGDSAHGDPMQDCMKTSAIISEANNMLPMTRAEFFRKNKCPVQRVYDEFLKWCAENPSEGNVMDFSTGVYNKGAAFAYWLQDVITVEIKA